MIDVIKAKRLLICQIIKDQADFWMQSNDIFSQTHFCDIQETLNGDDCNIFTEDEKQDIELQLGDLLIFLRNIKN